MVYPYSGYFSTHSLAPLWCGLHHLLPALGKYSLWMVSMLLQNLWSLSSNRHTITRVIFLKNVHQLMSTFSPNTVMGLETKLQPKSFPPWLCVGGPMACLTSSPSLPVAHSASAMLACLLLFKHIRLTPMLGLLHGHSSTCRALSPDTDMANSLTTFGPCSNINASVRLILHDPTLPDSPNPPVFTDPLLLFSLAIVISPSNILSNVCIYYVYYVLCISSMRIDVPLMHKICVALFDDN